VGPTGDVYLADASLWSSCRVLRLTNDGTLVPVAGSGTCGYTGDGGLATSAELYLVAAIAVDTAGDVFLADPGECRVREVAGGTITTVAGNGTCGFAGDGGPAAAAQLNHADGLALDAQGDLFISDNQNCRVRLVRGGTITTVAGDGSCRYAAGDGGMATKAGIEPAAIAVGPDGTLYIADAPNFLEQHASGGACRVRAVRDGTIETVAGTDCSADFGGDGGPAAEASLGLVRSLAVNPAGDLYIADGFCRVRIVRSGIIETVVGRGPDPDNECRYAGDGGPATSAGIWPGRIAVDLHGDLYITDGGFSCRVRRVQGGTIVTIAGNGTCPG
jgi:hypothetical protein